MTRLISHFPFAQQVPNMKSANKGAAALARLGYAFIAFVNPDCSDSKQRLLEHTTASLARLLNCSHVPQISSNRSFSPHPPLLCTSSLLSACVTHFPHHANCLVSISVVITYLVIQRGLIAFSQFCQSTSNGFATVRTRNYLSRPTCERARGLSVDRLRPKFFFPRRDSSSNKTRGSEPAYCVSVSCVVA